MNETYTPDVTTETGRRELNRGIAVARGFRVRKERSGYWGFYLPGESKPIAARLGEALAWECAPQVADSNEAAIDLLADCGWECIHYPNKGDYAVTIYRADNLYRGRADTLAQAAALAWWTAFGEAE